MFAEWATGGLTRTRLRLLAARVVAVAAMERGASFIDVYRNLTREHGFSKRGAFGIAARVFRSGGFAKDAIYLEGFRAVTELVAAGAPLNPFWLGKIAAAHVPAIEELLQRGLVQPPLFKPLFLEDEKAAKRIADCAKPRAFPKLSQEPERMLIAFFVNDLEREHPGYTTTVLAHQAAMRGHRVCYVTPQDFVLRPDDTPVRCTPASCPSANTRIARISSPR